LPADQWLGLFDFLFSSFEDVSNVSFALVAYLRVFRHTLLASTNKESIMSFLKYRNAPEKGKLLSTIKTIVKSTPDHLVQRLKDVRPSLLLDGDSPRQKIVFPLTVEDSYPPLTDYPTIIVSYQQQVRSCY
jgi:hypothetical protein